MSKSSPPPQTPPPSKDAELVDEGRTPDKALPAPKEIGGPRGLEPTRYGDWERNGRCYDF